MEVRSPTDAEEPDLHCKTPNPHVLGWIAQCNEKDGSDLDLQMGPLPGSTLFDLGSLQVALGAL